MNHWTHALSTLQNAVTQAASQAGLPDPAFGSDGDGWLWRCSQTKQNVVVQVDARARLDTLERGFETTVSGLTWDMRDAAAAWGHAFYARYLPLDGVVEAVLTPALKQAFQEAWSSTWEASASTQNVVDGQTRRLEETKQQLRSLNIPFDF